MSELLFHRGFFWGYKEVREHLENKRRVFILVQSWGERYKSLSGLHQEALVYGWLKPLGLKFYILDRGAAFDCCNYLPLYISA